MPFYKVLIWILGCTRIVFMLDCSKNSLFLTYFTLLHHLYSQPLLNDLFSSCFNEKPPSKIQNVFWLINWPSFVIGEPLRMCSRNDTPLNRTFHLHSCKFNNSVNFAIPFWVWFKNAYEQVDHAEPSQAQILQDVSKWYFFFFTVCGL